MVTTMGNEIIKVGIVKIVKIVHVFIIVGFRTIIVVIGSIVEIDSVEVMVAY